jgi:hypothetical protein
MLLTTLTLLLAAADLDTTTEPKWAVDYALTTPSLLQAAFTLASASPSGVGALGGVVVPGFTNALSLERTLGSQLTGVAALTFGYTQFAAGSSSLTGGGVLGVHWYQARALDGFWAGPELTVQLSSFHSSGASSGGVDTNSRAVGARARVGWTQRFGAHFLISASAAAGANLDSTTMETDPGRFSQTSVRLALDAALAAGVRF